ncbi:MAG TPA: hypothetical protein VN040_26650 [Pseudosphingobacterium sp.]|nr:hypothetical protein [Pseudosphingobacterium sp.]
MIPIIAFLLACNNKTPTSQSENKEIAIAADTSLILSKAYHYKEFNELINAIPFDTMYLVESKIVNDTANLHLNSSKHIELMERPEGYPKYDFGYNYDKLLLSFEYLKIEGDTARCIILNIFSGVLADFKLKKGKDGWQVLSYGKNMI